jgi:hypothetical protein
LINFLLTSAINQGIVMNLHPIYVSSASIISEYRSLLSRIPCPDGEKPKPEILAAALRDSGDWTESGAREMVRLANDYGAFMLRNALALAIAMGKEDGDRGF